MNDTAKTYDPRNLIREAYRIEGITLADCRSIFLDWALGRGPGEGQREGIEALLAHYADAPGDHPMTVVLRQALETPQRPQRRGGAMGRRS